MKNSFFIFLLIFSSVSTFEKNAYAQTSTKKADQKVAAPKSRPEDLAPFIEKNEENINNNSETAPVADVPVTTHSVNVKKKPFKLPGFIAPADTNADANCVDRLGGGNGKGDSGFTACQGARNSR